MKPCAAKATNSKSAARKSSPTRKTARPSSRYEEVIIEVPAEHVGAVQMELGQRRATLKEQFASPKGVTKLIYEMPTRALLGMRNILLTNTKGTIIMNSLTIGYEPQTAELQQLRNGVLIAYETGVTTPYSLQTAEARGTIYVNPAEKVYAGQIIGLNTRQEDMEINVCKAKHLTNMRSVLIRRRSPTNPRHHLQPGRVPGLYRKRRTTRSNPKESTTSQKRTRPQQTQTPKTKRLGG